MKRRAVVRNAVLALVTAAAAALAPNASAAGGAAVTGPATRFYTPAPNPDAVRQVADLTRAGRLREAAGVLRMITTPQAVWYGDEEPDEVRSAVAGVTRAAAAKHTVPVLTLYDVPGRDCANYSAGGATTSAEYSSWIDGVAAGIGNRRAVVILEPDSLALLPSDCGQDDAAGTKTAARYDEISSAVRTLSSLAGTRVYLDTGHPAWQPVGAIVPRLLKAGVADAAGFFTNVSNYQTDEADAWYGDLISSCLAYAQAGGDPADCPNQYWPRADAQAWLDTHVTADPAEMKHFVIDTSRNGQGPWTPPAGKYGDAQDWCNPPGRGLGARPTARTGDPLMDAKLWIKIPGESDGLCLRGTAGPDDPERGAPDPAAGHWFPQQALELVANAGTAWR
ncbi:glycoside hydrolase family 6 protein [Streptomyces sp. NPDC015220]|uniref:glycoside hydrolase family 6 protein n=1 Tax=Streptomyces sp. NPDC015220 TaxID=3364947 RepID=UPI0036F5C7DF